MSHFSLAFWASQVKVTKIRVQIIFTAIEYTSCHGKLNMCSSLHRYKQVVLINEVRSVEILKRIWV